MKNEKKTIRAWCMFDWANSAYSLIINSTILPVYFLLVTTTQDSTKVHFLGKEWENSALYNYTLALAFLLFSLMVPIINTLADRGKAKLVYMQTFTWVGSLSCMGLFFFNNYTLGLGLFFIMMASLGFSGSQTFYNSYLNDVVDKEGQDKVSAKGYAYGYVGSVILQLCCLLLFFFPDAFSIPKDSFLAFQISFVMVGLWWLGFSQITFRGLRNIKSNEKETHFWVILSGVVKKIRENPLMLFFIISFFFYASGVQTVMLVATQFAGKEIQMTGQELIIVILLLQIIAIPGAMLVAKFSGRVGNFKAVFWVVVLWTLCCCAAYFIETKMEFYALAVCIGFVMGGIQSLSRSTYSRLIPIENTDESASFFSFYDLTEKLAIVFGMLSYAFIEDFTGSLRNSVLSIIVFFLIGLIFLGILIKKEKISVTQ